MAGRNRTFLAFGFSRHAVESYVMIMLLSLARGIWFLANDIAGRANGIPNQLHSAHLFPRVGDVPHWVDVVRQLKPPVRQNVDDSKARARHTRTTY
jgi:hypothetical protein